MFGRRGFFKGIMLGAVAGIAASLLIDWNQVRERGLDLIHDRGKEREDFKEDLKEKLDAAKKMVAKSLIKESSGVSED